MRPLLFILITCLLVGGCTVPQRVVQVPVRESVQEELRQVKLEGDSTTLRMVFEHPLSAIRDVDFQQGKKSLTPDIHYRIQRDTIMVVASTPDQVVEVVEKTITQEVPVEVEVAREVRKPLRWWERVLISLGAGTLLWWVIRGYQWGRNFAPRKII